MSVLSLHFPSIKITSIDRRNQLFQKFRSKPGSRLIGVKSTAKLPYRFIRPYPARNLKSNRPRLICLSIRNCLLRGASRAGSLLDDGQSVESAESSRFLQTLSPSFQTVGPVTELAGQIQAMHNNRSPRKLWGWMVSGRIKQGGCTSWRGGAGRRADRHKMREV